MRLRDILNAKPTDGSHAAEVLLTHIDAYVMNPRTPKQGKIKALAKADEVLGLHGPDNPEYALRVYMTTSAEHYAS